MEENIEQQVLQAAKDGKLKIIQSYLQTNSLDILQIKDQNAHTVIHLASLHGHIHIVQYIIDWLDQNYPKQEEKKFNFLNEQTNDGFTCMHFAAFKGNLDLLKILVGYKADIRKISKQGLSLLHVAAQADQLTILAYLKQINMDIDIKDNKGSTPLHWAAYMGCELSVQLLLAWNADYHLKDQDGLTALHLGTLAGNSKIVRTLLLKGSNRQESDKRGRTAMDIAVANDLEHLVPLLKNPPRCSVFTCKPPLKPHNHHHKEVYTYIVLFVVCNILALFFVIPYIYGYEIFGIFYAAQGLGFIMFLIGMTKNPGYIYKKPNTTMLELLEKYDPILICPDCQVFRPYKSRHCHYCNKCVRKFDHHCPWINNCVGQGNHKIFVFVIGIIWAQLLITAVISLFTIVDEQYDVYDEFQILSEDILDYREPFVIFIIAVCLGFFCPVTALLLVQLKNIFLDTTTSELYSKSSGYDMKLYQKYDEDGNVLDISQETEDSTVVRESEYKIQQEISNSKCCVSSKQKQDSKVNKQIIQFTEKQKQDSENKDDKGQKQNY